MHQTRSLLARPLAAGLMMLAFALPAATPALGQGIAGPYLATRLAESSGDFENAVRYGIRAVAKDPQNGTLLERLVISQISLGEIGQAAPLARRLITFAPENQIAGLVLTAEAIHAGRWADVTALQEKGLGIGPLMDQVLAAWAEMGQGRMSQALTAFEALAGAEDGGSFASYHQSMALALAGDFEGAARIFEASGGLGLDRAGVIAYAQILSQIERFDDALDLLGRGFPLGGDDEIKALRGALEAGQPVPFTVIGSPRDGAAEAFFSVAQSLVRDLDPGVVLLYARVAQYLRPEFDDAALLTGSLLEMLEHYDLATEAYAQVPATSRLYEHAQQLRAEALRREGRPEEAIALLQELTATHGDNPDLWEALGDTLRAQRRFDEACTAYDGALGIVEGYDTVPPAAWATYFHRGICHEQMNRWPQAEADLRRALELSPDRPIVLNYLGYSYVEMRRNFDEALDMIERAVAARPNDGYITDSLGWVYFRLGRYPEAVKQMERAVELTPMDPVLNDHLGDTLWAVGRIREAEFQWRRALSFISERTDLSEIDPDRIRRKLEIGLDRVLAEEGGEPLHGTDATD